MASRFAPHEQEAARNLLYASRLLREEVASLRAENDRLRAELARANVETRP